MLVNLAIFYTKLQLKVIQDILCSMVLNSIFTSVQGNIYEMTKPSKNLNFTLINARITTWKVSEFIIR